jgi:hypothetical protein
MENVVTAFVMFSSAGGVEFYRRPWVRLYISVVYLGMKYG